MSRSRSANAGFLAIIFFLSVGAPLVAADGGNDATWLIHPGLGARLPLPLRPAEPTPLAWPSQGVQVALSGPHSTTSWDAREPGQPKFDLPLLYLHREQEVTAASERTLDIEIAGLAAATEIQIEAVSQHANVSTGASHTETANFITPDHPCTAADPCTVEWTFDAMMPSDLYTLRVKDRAGVMLWESRERPAFVALDTWDVALGTYTARVYYGTLFPFARGQNDLEDRLLPHQVTSFVEQTFLPIIRETWQTQFVEWGFGDPVHPDWDSDDVIEIVITDPPYALLDGTGTYSRLTGEDGRPYPERRIWWYAANNSFQAYDTLENAYKAVFAHEFFHLMQWNVLLSAGQASAKRPADMWISWIEGQGRFAPTVQYPELEMSHEHLVLENSAYTGGANRFLALHLNTSYTTLEGDRANKYDSALYWRFLYEQYGDMGIIRAALEEMVSHYGPDTVSAMKKAMDAALARVDGPFHSFEESLVAFARANYALRLMNGRRTILDVVGDRVFLYDPDEMYTNLPLEAELEYTGLPLTHSGAVPNSYGMDFFEITLDRSLQGQPLAVCFEGQGSAARFDIQIWKLGPGYGRPRAITPQPEIILQNGNGTYIYSVPHVDRMVYNRFALIITRLDANETLDPVGNYHFTLTSPARGDDDERNQDPVLDTVPGDGSVPG
jgi:hypothetical protein